MIIFATGSILSKSIIAAINERKDYFPVSTAVIITTASFPDKEKDKYIPTLKAELEYFGLSADYFDFDTDDPKKLFDYDVVAINDGNPFYLIKAIRNAKAESILKQISIDNLLICINNSTFALQKNLNLLASVMPEMNEDVGLTDFTGADIAYGYTIFPCYSSYLQVVSDLEDKIKEYEHENNCMVFRQVNGNAMIYRTTDEVVKMLGNDGFADLL